MSFMFLILLLGFLVCFIATLLLLAYFIVHFVGSFGVQKIDETQWTVEPDVPALLERQPDGKVKISWSDEANLIELRLGTDPEQIQEPVVFEVVSDSEVLVQLPDGHARMYFELMFSDHPLLVVAERFIPLEGACNFRDLGGYQTQDGRHVRWGKLFRTDALDEITSADQEYLSAMGLKLVCDLRSLEEFEQSPDLLPEGVEQAHLPINTGNWMQQVWKALFLNRKTLQETMKASYPQLLQTYPENIKGVLSRFVDPQNLPAAFHCTAGKDRAGITAALVLSLLGVPDETIVAEYSISNYSFKERAEKFNRALGPRMRRYGIPLRDLEVFNAADPAWMAAALVFLREEYGSTEDYLLNVVGLTAQELAAIRENLLD